MKICLFVFALLLSSAAPALAKTMYYVGASFDETHYSTSSDDPLGYSNRGPDDTDRLVIQFEMAADLTPDTTYTTYGDWTPLGGAGHIISMAGSAYAITRPVDAWIRTDAAGQIFDWYITQSIGSGADIHRVMSTPDGDQFQYTYEYEYSGCSTGPSCFGAETLRLSTLSEGRWTEVLSTPLPAGLLLLISGIAGLAGLKRRQQRS